MTVNLNSD